jgi:hypothetical protein
MVSCAIQALRFRSSLIHLSYRRTASFTTINKLTNDASLFSQDGQVLPAWKEFYSQARALRGDLNLSKDSHTVDEILQKIERTEPFNFPKEGDLMLNDSCMALSHALQNASEAKVDSDTAEVEKALQNLRNAYEEAAKSNTVWMNYVDVCPPYRPFSPLSPHQPLRRIVLARSWMKELITRLQNQTLVGPILAVGNPGIGEFLAYLASNTFLGLHS